MSAVCEDCNDTHVRSDGHMCTRCPVPCQRCRAGGNGPFCSSTPCPCACHRARPSITEQPAPKPGGVPVWASLLASGLVPAELVADCKARDALGRERYGTPLQAHNGRDALTDAYQEALDLCVYLWQARLETTGPFDINDLESATTEALDLADNLHELIEMRRRVGTNDRAVTP